MVQVLDGGALSKALREKLAEEIADEKLSPGLVVVLVGDNPASQIYVRNKTKAAEKAGIRSQTHHLPASTTQEELLALIDKLNADETVHGILVQLPLPKTIDTERILVAIDPEKDVDGFHPVNAGRLSLGLPGFVPCTPMGCMLLLHEAMTDTAGKRALVIGRSNIVGTPVAQLLMRANCTVTIAHSGTQDVPSEVSRADILVTAIGDPEFVKGAWIKQGAVIIDVGINRIPDLTKPGNTKIVGDVEFKAACERAAAITPVPGGVGPMTITCLLKNTVQAARARVSR